MAHGLDCWSTAASPATNYRPCHLKVPRLLAATATLSPRCPEIESQQRWICSSARTSFSAGEEPLRSACRECYNKSCCSGVEKHVYQTEGNADMIMLPTCKSQLSSSPYYTKYLERKMETLQGQHEVVLNENLDLNNQLSRLTLRCQELRDRARVLEDNLRREKAERDSLYSACQRRPADTLHQGVNTTLTGSPRRQEASTSPEPRCRRDAGAQTPSSRPVDSRHQQQQASAEPERSDAPTTAELVSISKSELDLLQSDMRTLRDAVRKKEEQWALSLEREKSYMDHLARLSVELITVRQLSDTRLNEMQGLVQKLTDKKEELRATQKDLASAKKNLAKFQKQNRNSEENESPDSTIASLGDNLDTRGKQQQQQQQQQHSRPPSAKPEIQSQCPAVKLKCKVARKDSKGAHQRTPGNSPRIETPPPATP